MKRSNSGRLALLFVLGLPFIVVCLIGVNIVVTRNNCCPLVVPLGMGWFVSPLYSIFPTILLLTPIMTALMTAAGKKRPTLRDLLIDLFFGFLLSIVLVGSTSTIGIYVNAKLDFSHPQTYQAQVISKRPDTASTKAPNMYYIVTTDWQAERGQTVEMRVPSESFRMLEVGMMVHVTTCRGFLGHEWLKQIEPST